MTYAVGRTSIVVLALHLNSDSFVDLVTVNGGSADVSVLLGNGDGTFQPHQTFAAGINPRPAAVGDFNGDNRLDLVVPNETADTLSVLVGNGDGTFQSAVTYATGDGPHGAVAAHLNGDIWLDLAVANIGDNSVSVLLGSGGGTFQAQQTYSVGNSPFALTAADMNGDGNVDIIAANSGSGNVSVLLGNGDGTFQTRQNTGVGSPAFSVSAADLNADGRPDLAVAHFFINTVSVLPGAASGSLQFSSPTFSVDEGGGTASVTLTRTGSTDGQVSAIVSLSGGTATQGTDYAFSSPQTVTWADGDGTAKTVSIPINQDQIDEADETILLTASLPTNPFAATLGSQTTTTVTVTDDDVVTLNIAGVTQAEGDSGTSNATFTVTRTGQTERTVTVQYATTNGSATAGSDYTATSGTLTFLPADTSKQIVVPIIGDTLFESDETFIVTLSNPTNATLVVAQATGTIQNDELGASACAPRPRVTPTLTAGGGALSVHVESTPLNTNVNNPLISIKFGTFLNATVTMNGQAIASGQTVTMPANTFAADFEVRRVAAGQSTTVEVEIVDGCGGWSTFVGGGASAGF